MFRFVSSSFDTCDPCWLGLTLACRYLVGPLHAEDEDRNGSIDIGDTGINNLITFYNEKEVLHTFLQYE